MKCFSPKKGNYNTNITNELIQEVKNTFKDLPPNTTAEERLQHINNILPDNEAKVHTIKLIIFKMRKRWKKLAA